MIKRILSMAALALALAGCGEAESLQEVSSSIESTETRDGTIVVTMKTSGMDAGHNDFFSISDDMRRAAKWQVANGGPFEIMEFDVHVPTQDKYGNATAPSRAMMLRFKAEDLTRINWKNFTNWDLLNFAHIKMSNRFGNQLMQGFCSDEDSRKYSNRFCLNALAAMVRG